jgi:type III pantothenate kinase
MTTWLFDLGNTRLKCAPLRTDGEAAIDQVLDAAHDGTSFDGDWPGQLPPRIDNALIASVATPALTAVLLDGLTSRAGRISLARTLPACAGVRIAYAQPWRLGVDRFLAMLAAHADAQDACLVVGVGTALTIDLLDATGRHQGGRIAPSPTLMREALHARAPQLPAGGGQYTEFADDTAAALASGCEGAALALIAQSRQAARSRLGVTPRLLLHGGGAAALLPHLPDAIFAPALVLTGLARWASPLARA